MDWTKTLPTQFLPRFHVTGQILAHLGGDPGRGFLPFLALSEFTVFKETHNEEEMKEAALLLVDFKKKFRIV